MARAHPEGRRTGAFTFTFTTIVYVYAYGNVYEGGGGSVQNGGVDEGI